MGKASDIPLEKISIRLYEGDKDAINALYPVQGHNAVIRKLVNDHIKQVKYVVNEKAKANLDYELEDLALTQGD